MLRATARHHSPVDAQATGQRCAVVAGLVPESSVVMREPVDLSGMPVAPTSLVLPLRDNSLKPALQCQFIDNLGIVDEVVEIDTCHNVMMSEPARLAELLLARR